MRRLRFFRVLLPALLILVLAVLFYTVKPVPTAHTVPATDLGQPDTERMEEASVIEYDGTERKLAGEAAVVQQGDDGHLLLREIRKLEVARRGKSPLVISARRGEGVGQVGERLWDFDGAVVIADPDEQLELRLPGLAIDETRRIASASGEILFSGPGLEGRAASLEYGLEGQPRELRMLDASDAAGRRLSAARAILIDGLREIGLEQEVRLTTTIGGQIDSERMRIVRGPDDRLERVTAAGRVRGTMPLGETRARLEAERADVRWDERGAPWQLLLDGQVELGRGEESLTAERVEATRVDRERSSGGWRVVAGPDVYIRGNLLDGAELLRCDRLEADLDPTARIESAVAHGRVSFEGSATRAEAERARFSNEGAGELQLFGSDLRKARLAREDSRVAADWIRTDPRGERLTASGRVEATLLPHTGPGRSVGVGPFEPGQAIHFVSGEFESTARGARLVFRGSTRGWQGERNLAADRVVIDQQARTLEATRGVTTRMPRERSGPGAGEADYLQILSDRLFFDDDDRLATYEGNVRLSLVEGWLEADRLEVRLGAGTRHIEHVLARGRVRIEFHQTAEGHAPRLVSGQADRVEFEPSAETVLLVGEQGPATVRRIGDGGGTTRGRVLRYRLDLGTLEVDSRERSDASIEKP